MTNSFHGSFSFFLRFQDFSQPPLCQKNLRWFPGIYVAYLLKLNINFLNGGKYLWLFTGISGKMGLLKSRSCLVLSSIRNPIFLGLVKKNPRARFELPKNHRCGAYSSVRNGFRRKKYAKYRKVLPSKIASLKWDLFLILVVAGVSWRF